MNAIEMLRAFSIELENECFNSAGDELMALCPFHKERNRSFFLNVDKCIFYCFGCGESGNIYHLIEHFTGLHYDEIRKAIAPLLGGVGGGLEDAPDFTLKPIEKKELRTLSDLEIDALTLYAKVSHRLLKGEACVDPTHESVLIYTDYLEKARGISLKAQEYFMLGANRYSFLNLGKGSKHQVWFWEMVEIDHPYGAEIVNLLRSFSLINRRGSDYWFRPAILIPYQYQGEVYWINARHIPPWDEEIKYMGMRGIKRAHLFNEDALSEILIKEGQYLKAGDLVAKLSYDNEAKLAFEEQSLIKLIGKLKAKRDDVSSLFITEAERRLSEIQEEQKKYRIYSAVNGRVLLIRTHVIHNNNLTIAIKLLVNAPSPSSSSKPIPNPQIEPPPRQKERPINACGRLVEALTPRVQPLSPQSDNLIKAMERKAKDKSVSFFKNIPYRKKTHTKFAQFLQAGGHNALKKKITFNPSFSYLSLNRFMRYQPAAAFYHHQSSFFT